jgi:hypothetical protein
LDFCREADADSRVIDLVDRTLCGVATCSCVVASRGGDESRRADPSRSTSISPLASGMPDNVWSSSSLNALSGSSVDSVALHDIVAASRACPRGFPASKFHTWLGKHRPPFRPRRHGLPPPRSRRSPAAEPSKSLGPVLPLALASAKGRNKTGPRFGLLLRLHMRARRVYTLALLRARVRRELATRAVGVPFRLPLLHLATVLALRLLLSLTGALVLGLARVCAPCGGRLRGTDQD